MKKWWVIFTLCVGCAPVYVPNIRNSPMFTQAGEFQGTFQLGNGIDVQSALSLTNNIGLMGNFSYADRTGVQDPDQYHFHKFYEGAIGYFKNKGRSSYEIFAGYGKGAGSGYDAFEIFGSAEKVRARGEFERFFIQPAIGFNKKRMEVSFSSRFSFVNMYAFTDEINQVSYSGDRLAVFFEPAMVARMNLAHRRLYVTYQIGGSALLSEHRVWDHRPLQWGIGMGFRIGGVGDSL